MVTVNAMGDKCPVPVIKTKKALDALTAPETIEVLVDNETAVANVTKMAQSTGAAVTQEKLGEDEYKVTIQALAGEGTQTAAAGAVCDCVPTGDTVVVISSDKMGRGNDELGKVLIKGCIFAITQLDELPFATISSAVAIETGLSILFAFSIIISISSFGIGHFATT